MPACLPWGGGVLVTPGRCAEATQPVTFGLDKWSCCVMSDFVLPGPDGSPQLFARAEELLKMWI